MTPTQLRQTISDLSACDAFSAELAETMRLKISPQEHFNIFLQGDLGSGKTTLARAFIHQLGFSGHVKSPTYPLVQTYSIEHFNIQHFDFYRFESADEFLEAGLQELFEEPAWRLMEWPEKAGHYLGSIDLRIELKIHTPVSNSDTAAPNNNELADHERLLTMIADSAKGQQCLNHLAKQP